MVARAGRPRPSGGGAKGRGGRGAWALAWVLLPGLALARPAAGGPAADGGSDSGTPASAGEVIDRVVAVVGGELVTQSELELEARVWLVERGGWRAADAPLDAQTLGAALELTLTQRLQVQDAERLQAFRVEPEAVEARLGRLRAQFEDEAAFQAFLDRHDTDVAAVGALLERALRAERVLDRRIRLRALVAEAEVRRYYETHARELGLAPYEAVRESLREKLHRERYVRLAQEELLRVRAAGQVRLVAPLARGERP